MNFDVPGPEAGWLDAPVSACANPNPAWQTSMWWYISGLFRVVAGLAPSLDSVAVRFKLTTERGWEELSPVDVAMIQIRGVHFALHRMEFSPMTDTIVSVINETDDDEAAIDILLDALGIGREALTFRGDFRRGDDEVEWLPAARPLDRP
ncbi:hypothetical protein ACE1OC_41305 [Streptomyces sp. DSM 116496]|uniref:hypothetical protein n=1 Tax=Streptomyces stoeckheimensis TaxID=3344656 RepID=UPI0038B331F4